MNSFFKTPSLLVSFFTSALVWSTVISAEQTQSQMIVSEEQTQSQTCIDKKKPPSWLFVVQAKSGTITQLTEKEATSTEQAEKKYTLTLKHTDDDLVIAFTDRPFHRVVYVKAKQLEANWSKGNDSFKKNPPNAVLSSAGMKHPVIVVLDSMKSDGTTTTFTFHSAKHNPTDVILTTDILDHVIKNELQLTNVMVTIDNEGVKICTELVLASSLDGDPPDAWWTGCLPWE